ncbi:MAG: hypothetical protein AAF632_22615 [Bacteroidota bacterium]
MQVSELKDILIQRIQSTEDEDFLNALKVLTDRKLEDYTYELTDFEKSKIARARQQVTEGKVYTQEEVFESVNTWLKEK